MRSLSLDEYHALLAHIEAWPDTTRWRGLRPGPLQTNEQFLRQGRDLVMVLLMAEAGLRVGELAKLHPSYVYQADRPVRMLILPAHIAKGGRARELPLNDLLQQALARYAGCIGYEHRIKQRGCLFPRRRGGGPLGVRAIQRIIRHYGRLALARNLTPHMLRHTFADRLRRVTDLRTVQTLLGHKHLSTTEIYTHPTDEDRRNAVNALNPAPPPGPR